MARPWRIVINGEGPSRNDREDDADALAQELLTLLRAGGHRIKAAILQDDTGKNYPLTKADPELPSTNVLNTEQRAALERAQTKARVNLAAHMDSDKAEKLIEAAGNDLVKFEQLAGFIPELPPIAPVTPEPPVVDTSEKSESRRGSRGGKSQ